MLAIIIITIFHFHLLALVQPSGARDQISSLFNLNAPHILKETHYINPLVSLLKAKLCRLLNNSSNGMVLRSSDILFSFIQG